MVFFERDSYWPGFCLDGFILHGSCGHIVFFFSDDGAVDIAGRPEPCGIVKPDRVLRGIDHGFRSVHTDRHDPVLHSGPLPALKEELQILGRLDKGDIFISFDAVSSDRIIGPECQFFVDMAVFPCDGNILRGYLRVLRCGSRG